MRFKKLFYLVTIFLLIQTVIISNVYGNPIFPYYFDPFSLFFLIPILYLLTSIIEYGIILQFIKKYVINRRKFAGTIFKINLITYPLSQVITYIISFFTLNIFDYYTLIIEVIVIIVEYYLLKKAVFKLIRTHFIDESIQPVNLKKIFLAVLISNIITFILGILVILPFYLHDISFII